YLSLAGRYSVLMPNTARGGGISRKISNATDRKRLKQIAEALDVPEGMGVILRTAGANRTKAEVRRDFEYLLRLWENVRTLTLESRAPCLVHEEGSLVKRAIRDLYSKDIDQVMVSGEESYREAKAFMKMLMPSHAKNVQEYKDEAPLFFTHGIEAQLDALFHPQVTLRSGGYIVINQTEALVAIDVNSGRSTKEHNIEDTALKTNLEAAEEVARQLRLRDLAGLVVIDFIDMEENRNNRAVERKLKDCLKDDRARIQMGRISSFGLLEMSRQRIRSSVLEGSSNACPHCDGTGYIRATESVALHILRAIEDAIQGRHGHQAVVQCSVQAAFYILNKKRSYLNHFSEHLGIDVDVEGATDLHGVDMSVTLDGERVAVLAPAPQADDDDGDRKRKRRSRRRRDSNDGDAPEAAPENEPAEAADGDASNGGEERSAAAGTDEDGQDRPKRGRRRGRRGGRRHRKTDAEGADGETEVSEETEADGDAVAADGEAKGDGDTVGEGDEGAPKQKRSRGRRGRRGKRSAAQADDDAAETKADADSEAAAGDVAAGDVAESAPEVEEAETPIEVSADAAAPSERPSSEVKEPEEPTVEASANGHGEAAIEAETEDEPEAETPDEAEPVVATDAKEPEADPGPKRKGWWQRRFSSRS
ncbi:MAG: Rne/Rng family ribonuclease, partial [Pseudomonadota bacterium]